MVDKDIHQPPAHICGQLIGIGGRKNKHTAERNAWIVDQSKAGFSTRRIADALGVGMDSVNRATREARIAEGGPTRMPAVSPGAQRGLKLTVGKQIVTFNGTAGIVSHNRVSIACLAGDECERRPDARPETNPSFTLVRPNHPRRPVTDVDAVIEAIRAELRADEVRNRNISRI